MDNHAETKKPNRKYVSRKDETPEEKKKREREMARIRQKKRREVLEQAPILDVVAAEQLIVLAQQQFMQGVAPPQGDQLASWFNKEVYQAIEGTRIPPSQLKELVYQVLQSATQLASDHVKQANSTSAFGNQEADTEAATLKLTDGGLELQGEQLSNEERVLEAASVLQKLQKQPALPCMESTMAGAQSIPSLDLPYYFSDPVKLANMGGKGTRGALVPLSSAAEVGIVTYLGKIYKQLHPKGENMTAVQSSYKNLLQKNYQDAGEGLSFFKEVAHTKEEREAVEGLLRAVIKRKLLEVGYCNEDQDIQFWVSFLTSKTTRVQDPHIDYKWEDIDPEQFMGKKPRSYKEGCYKEWVPFIAMIPLTEEGMVIEIWPLMAQEANPQGQLVHIGLNNILLLRADVVHAGGYATSSEGNPRVHLYVTKSGGQAAAYPPANSYNFPHSTTALSSTYKHATEAEDIYNDFFFRRDTSKSTEATRQSKIPARGTKGMDVPLDFTAPPDENGVTWNYNPRTRVLLVNFSQCEVVGNQEKIILAELMEARDDITIICVGLLPPFSFTDLNQYLMSKQCLGGLGDYTYPKFREFRKVTLPDTSIDYQERASHVSMRMDQYCEYLNIYMGVAATEGKKFSYTDSKGVVTTIEDATKVVFYLIDLDMTTHMRNLDIWYHQKFKIKEMLPAGDWCAMNQVSALVNSGV
jgi:hypothetical protein